MEDVSDYRDFAGHIFAVVDGISDVLEQYPPRKAVDVPKDWPETQAMLQKVADDLMLCVDVDHALQKLKEDQGTLIILRWLITEMDDAILELTIRSAYASRPPRSKTLPGQAFATFLLELREWPSLPLIKAGNNPDS